MSPISSQLRRQSVGSIEEELKFVLAHTKPESEVSLGSAHSPVDMRPATLFKGLGSFSHIDLKARSKTDLNLFYSSEYRQFMALVKKIASLSRPWSETDLGPFSLIHKIRQSISRPGNQTLSPSREMKSFPASKDDHLPFNRDTLAPRRIVTPPQGDPSLTPDLPSSLTNASPQIWNTPAVFRLDENIRTPVKKAGVVMWVDLTFRSPESKKKFIEALKKTDRGGSPFINELVELPPTSPFASNPSVRISSSYDSLSDMLSALLQCYPELGDHLATKIEQSRNSLGPVGANLNLQEEKH